MDAKRAARHRSRDAASLLLMGAFFAVMGLLVLVGSFWAAERFRAMVVNTGAGVILSAIGIGMLYWGWRLRRPQGETQSSAQPE